MGNSASVHQSLLKRDLGRQVEFTINGKEYKIGDEVAGDTSLNTFIREHAHLKGTKYMCLEGGCGTCIVTVQFNHPATMKKLTYAANSCLVPIFACHGWNITTIEGVGSKYKGYADVQTRLAAANGTQCGYCSPGMVMNMHSLLEENPERLMKDIENSFGGNICRCTGYRPILDAFKSFAKDAPKELKQKLIDIEDSMICPKNGNVCKSDCNSKCSSNEIELLKPIKPVAINLQDGSQWYRPANKEEVFEVIDMIEGKSYRYVGGNTGQGVYRINKLPEVWIDLSGIPELHDWNLGSDCVTLGANISLTETMAIFNKLAAEHNSFQYCKAIADHIDLIANVPVRNMGTIGGNISLKYQHHEFPSDVFLTFETVGTTVTIDENSGVQQNYPLKEFLNIDMNNKLITNFKLPALDDSYVVRTYKIMPRAQNAHAYVNAGFKFKLRKKDNFTVLEPPSIVFGGIDPGFIHATKTEQYLNGKSLLNPDVLKKALDILSSELHPDHVLPDASPEYRKGLALSLFYKFVLSVNPNAVHPKYRSGGTLLERPVSSGKQDFDSNKQDWPVNKPIPKIEGLIQCSGEAEYSNDVASFPNELWAQLVLCDRSGAVIEKIDASEALAYPGVHAFFSAKDVPHNTFCPPNVFFLPFKEKVFAEGRTDYAGQAVGIIVADTASIALRATQLVKITYGKVDDVITDPMVVIKKNIQSRITELAKITPTQQKDDVKFKIKGEWIVPSQYHNFMEAQTCVAVPNEGNLDIYPAAQWPGCTHEAIAYALDLPQNLIHLKIRRLGGGYGGKITIAMHTAVSCSLAAYKLNRPVRLVLNIETCMEQGGKRFPIMSFYEAGVDANGVIQNLDLKIYEDDGYSPNDAPMNGTLQFLSSCYDKSTWSVSGNLVRTDNASNTWCRAPGSVEGTSIMENIMDHIAKVTGKDPVSVRLANTTPDNPVIQMIEEIKKTSDYDTRMAAVNKFNEDNRWKKRGISLVPLQYPFDHFGNFYGSVSVFRNDGTVALTHSAIEMGQGANTKVVQVAAYVLGVDVENISVKPFDSNHFPNSFVTGGSFGSESAAYAIKKACEELNERLKPVKEKLGPNAKWKDIILQADMEGINLTSKYMFSQTQEKLSPYFIYGTAVTEVEVDILTGLYEIIRMDVIEDAGQSLSQDIDIGQVEGSIMMGIGLFTTEELVYDPNSGRLLTTRTWNYKPPGAKDIPIDLRVTLKKKSPNPVGIMRSKATGEPPLCLSHSVVHAIRHALDSARKDSGQPDNDWLETKLPFSRERIWLASKNSTDKFVL